jgi:nucleoside-diphosphate-sugar epimerase
MRVLIAGCGYVGTALGRMLAKRGHTPFGLRRDPRHLPPDIQPVAADLTDPHGLASALPGDIHAVVYCAGPSASTDEAYAETYVRGLTHVLDALEGRGEPPGRVLLTTSTAVYAQTDGSWVDETSPTEPTHFSGRRLLEAEAALAARPYPTVALRLAGIYGPGRTGLLRRVWEGTARRPAQPRYTNRIHRDDCAGMLAHLLEVKEPASTYIGVDDAPADMSEVMLWLAAALGVPPPPAEAPGTKPTGRRGTSHKRCRNQRITASGYRLCMPTYRDGYEPLIRTFAGTDAT